MKLRIVFTAISMLFVGYYVNGKVVNNPKAVSQLLERIGGNGASKLISTQLDDNIEGETFVISANKGKPCVKASTLSALTCGIGWYLNHYANINLAWNHPSTTLATANLPVPKLDEKHSCSVDYRYYLNYCTFSYSMSTWTWERWQQEIDWMALHGVNMPLQIVGLEVVWRNMLRNEYGYSDDEVNDFVAGPCFMAWFGMNNLEGWGGPNPEWWYARQEQLCKKINSRMHELGIEPVLPGYCGMVPSNFSEKTGISAINQGKWCNFRRPYILDPNIAEFGDVAAKYYKHLHKVMGKSRYYSMDPFHEGANTSEIDVDAAYAHIYNEMNRANSEAKWVIQQWQWSKAQYKVLANVPEGRLIVLDLFSDGRPNLAAYNNHDVVYCILPNFGGRTGIMGRFDKVINEFFAAKDSIKTICGIGAAPEAIEQVPVLYDAVYELPWLEDKPNGKQWMKDYAIRRYGKRSEKAIEAWQLMRTTVLNCESGLQGPQEAVTCARPSWNVDRVSSWGGTKLFYDASAMAKAAKLLSEADIDGYNYRYDLIDFTRQALTDYAYTLLERICRTKQAELEQEFLALIDDLDQLLSTDSNFMLGKWTNMARNIADEMPGTTSADKDWLEHNNARTLITTWGERENSEVSGLHDYSYRQWAGMLKNFYSVRWQKFFAKENMKLDQNDENMQQDSANSDGLILHEKAEERAIDWFKFEREWALDDSTKYTDTSCGDTKYIAKKLLNRYFER